MNHLLKLRRVLKFPACFIDLAGTWVIKMTLQLRLKWKYFNAVFRFNQLNSIPYRLPSCIVLLLLIESPQKTVLGTGSNFTASQRGTQTYHASIRIASELSSQLNDFQGTKLNTFQFGYQPLLLLLVFFFFLESKAQPYCLPA